MIKTLGLTHLHLMVSDIQRSLKFYQRVFGMEVRFWAGKDLVFLNTPGANDMIALHQAEEGQPTGASGGILHFGLQLEKKDDLEHAINEVIAAGGALVFCSPANQPQASITTGDCNASKRQIDTR